jgi:hypothetical protein
VLQSQELEEAERIERETYNKEEEEEKEEGSGAAHHEHDMDLLMEETMMQVIHRDHINKRRMGVPVTMSTI